jgi:hypothetical protein
MKGRPLRRGFAFALGLLIALGMSLSAIQASDMTVAMATAADMSTHGTGDCGGGCGDPEDNGGKAMICGVVCVAPFVAVLSQTPSMTFGHPADVQFESNSRLRDWASAPDPYPPRSSDLG